MKVRDGIDQSSAWARSRAGCRGGTPSRKIWIVPLGPQVINLRPHFDNQFIDAFVAKLLCGVTSLHPAKRFGERGCQTLPVS
jgi:hypothetical protein